MFPAAAPLTKPMANPMLRHLRAYTVRGGGADYHDQQGPHWIDDHIATPMSKYPEYRQSRRSFGIDVLEAEASDGTVGFAVTTGGVIGPYIVENNLAASSRAAASRTRSHPGSDVQRHAVLGPKAFVLNAISGVDLALWDLLVNAAASRCINCWSAPGSA